METHHRFPLMAGHVEIILYDVEQHIAENLVDEARTEGERLQKICNFYDPQSELSRLNKKRFMTVSHELYEVLTTALFYCEKSGGLYDISHGKHFLARKQGRELTQLHCTYKDIIVDSKNVTLTHPDVLIDLGSIAKGYIGDKILEFIKGQGVEKVFVDARGDMRASGMLQIINIQHPRENDLLHPFILENMAVATSGDYQQYVGTYATSHIVGSTDLASVTVLAPTLMHADAIATVLFVVGSKNAPALLPAYAQALLITANGKEISLQFPTLEVPLCK